MGFIKDGVTGQVYEVNPGLGSLSTLLLLGGVNSIVVGLAVFLFFFLDWNAWYILLGVLLVLVPFNVLVLYYKSRNEQIRSLVEGLNTDREGAEEALIDNYPNEPISRQLMKSRSERNDTKFTLDGFKGLFERWESYVPLLPKAGLAENKQKFGQVMLGSINELENGLSYGAKKIFRQDIQNNREKARRIIGEGDRGMRSRFRREKALARRR